MAKKKTTKKPFTEHLELVSETIIDSYRYTVFENADVRIDISSETDYGGCYYEGDSPSIETKMRIYKKVWK